MSNVLPEMKKKVLVWADSPTCSTGFATVSRNVLKVLYDTGKYDFDVVGINHGGQPHDFPYKIWPAMNPVAADKRYQVPHGFQLFVDMAGKGIYDIIFIIQDTFIVSHVMDALEKTWNKVEKKFSVVYYFPIDATPKKEWITKVVSKLHYPVAYTQYAKSEAEVHDPNLYKMPIIYHGVNKEEFFPMDKQVVKKEMYKEKADKFIILSVARNQPRKDLLRTFMGYSLFRKKHPDSFFYILAQANDVGGNLIELAANCGLEYGKDWGCPPPEYSANQGFPVSTVNMIYNSADLVVSTAHGEGFGLHNSEAMATQTPLLVPKNTAYTEIIGENEERGYFIKSGTDANLWSYHGASDNNVLRPVVDVYDMVDKMCYIKEHYGEALTKAHAGFKWIPSWEDVGKEWVKVFEKAEKVPDKFAYVFK